MGSAGFRSSTVVAGDDAKLLVAEQPPARLPLGAAAEEHLGDFPRSVGFKGLRLPFVLCVSCLARYPFAITSGIASSANIITTTMTKELTVLARHRRHAPSPSPPQPHKLHPHHHDCRLASLTPVCTPIIGEPLNPETPLTP